MNGQKNKLKDYLFLFHLNDILKCKQEHINAVELALQ